MHFTAILLGATRRVMTGKHGNKNFYKGRGVRNHGFPSQFGVYRIVRKKVSEFIVPDLTDFEMKPYVSYRVPQIVASPLNADRLLAEIKTNIDIVKHKEVP